MFTTIDPFFLAKVEPYGFDGGAAASTVSSRALHENRATHAAQCTYTLRGLLRFSVLSLV